MEQNKAERLNENVTEKMCSSDGNVVGEMCSPADADTRRKCSKTCEGKPTNRNKGEITIRNFRIVQTEGSRQVTRDTKDYTIKGWVIDDERLKRGTYLTEKYFDEQLECIREIRASERKFYQKITDLYTTAIDDDKNSATTRRFYTCSHRLGWLRP